MALTFYGIVSRDKKRRLFLKSPEGKLTQITSNRIPLDSLVGKSVFLSGELSSQEKGAQRLQVQSMRITPLRSNSATKNPIQVSN